MDPFAWLDSIFGGNGGGGYASAGDGGPRLDQGFGPVIGWGLSQSFAGAGPVGQYFGMLYGSPRTSIPTVSDMTPNSNGDSTFARRGGEWGTYQRSDEFSFAKQQQSASAIPDHGDAQPVKTADATQQSGESRTLEVLDRGQSMPNTTSGQIEEVRVFGTPRVQPVPNDWWPGMDAYMASQRTQPVYYGGEIPLKLDVPPLMRPPQPRRAPRKPEAVGATPPMVPEPRPERDQVDAGPYFDAEQTPSTTTASDRTASPWASDAPVPEKFLPWGSWDSPEKLPTPRLERGDINMASAARVESLPAMPAERSLWSRGGTGLAAGAVTASLGVAAVMWWNPVGWAALGAALAIAGGVAATTASAVELTASYAGATSPEQDARMNEAVSAALGYSSPGGVLGGVFGTVWADDPEQGFVQGAMWGGLFEGATSLPGTLRAIPGIWRSAMPWAKSLLLSPIWFLMSVGGGRGGVRSLARLFAAQGRIASRVRQVEFLGTTPLLERDADWARFQVFATRTRNESVFRITYSNGQQRIVLADNWQQTDRLIQEAKLGNMGQMFNPTREAHVIRQARNYLDIATVTGGRVRYVVSTELGASRLGQRFGLDFPAEMGSGQLWIDWVPWRR